MAGPWGCPRLHAAGIGDDGGDGGCGCGCRNNNGGGGAAAEAAAAAVAAAAAAAAAAGGDGADDGGCDGAEAVTGRASPPLKAAGTL